MRDPVAARPIGLDKVKVVAAVGLGARRGVAQLACFERVEKICTVHVAMFLGTRKC